MTKYCNKYSLVLFYQLKLLRNSSLKWQTVSQLLQIKKNKLISKRKIFVSGGFVRIFSENDKLNPIAAIFDATVLPVRYVSFCAYDNLVRFYYDCNGK